MADWIEQLERLTRLHKAGALTDAEFAAQKARILAAQDGAPPVAPAPVPAAPTYAAPVHNEADYDQANYDGADHDGAEPFWQRNRAMILGAAALLVIAFAAWFGSSLVKPGPDKEIKAEPQASASDAAGLALATPSAAAALPVALDGTLTYAAADQCKAGPVLEALYKQLDAAMERGSGKGESVKLDAFDAPLAVWAKSVSSDADMTTTQDAAVKFPEGTTWHELRLSRLATHRVVPEGSDSSYTRSISFLEPADKVQRVLGRLGFGAPREPDYAPLQDEACGGAAQVVSLNGGSALTCNWGC